MAKGRRVDNHFSRHYSPVKIYLDDIEKIIELFDSVSQPYIITVNEKYEYDSLNDVLENEISNKVSDLKISGNKQISLKLYIDINFKQYYANVFASHKSMESKGVVSIIDDIISSRQKALGFLYRRNVFMPLLIIAMPFYLMYSNTKEEIGKTWIVIIGLLALATFYFYHHYATHKSFSTIYLTRKSSHTSFYKNNKEKLILILLTAIVSSIFTALFYYLRERYFKNK